MTSPKKITFPQKIVVIRYVGDPSPRQVTLKESIVALRGLLPEIDLLAESGYFQFNTFPGHIIYPFFNQTAHVCIQFVRSPAHHKLKVIINISLSTL